MRQHTRASRSGPARFSRSSRLVAILAALALTLMACGGDDPEETDEPETEEPAEEGEAEEPAEEEPAEEGEAAGDGGTITIWFNGESVPADEFAQVEADYGVTVEYDIRGDEILNDMLRMAEAGQELPDIVEVDSHLTPAFIEAGLIAPMGDMQAEFEAIAPDVYAATPESVWEDGTFDGELYHMPNKSLVNAIYYNIGMFEEAGIEPVFETWDDVLEAARTIQENNPDLPAYWGNGGASHDRVFNYLYGFGVPFEGNIPDLTSDQGIGVITFLQTLFDEGLVDPEFQIGQQDESKGAFAAGELPMLDEGLNGGPGFMLDDFVYGEDWATTPRPIHEEDGGVQMGAPRGLSLSTDADQEAAAAVIAYLQSTPIAEERYLELESGVVQNNELLDGERLREEQPFFTDEMLASFRDIGAVIPYGLNTNAVGEVLVALHEELTVVGTDETPEEIAERYQAELDALA